MFSKWIAALRLKRNQQWYEDGFAWAMVEHYVRGTHLNDIEDAVYGVPDSFDKGALAALRKIEENSNA